MFIFVFNWLESIKTFFLENVHTLSTFWADGTYDLHKLWNKNKLKDKALAEVTPKIR